MEMNEKRPEQMHPFVDIDGLIADGKQFDLEITLANDHRDVIYGVVKDCFKEPVKDAVVKLVEVDYKYGKKELKPVSHTFTDKEGEFVFGPLCPGKKYAIQIWKDDVKHIKICAKCHHEGKCLKGIEFDCDCKDDYKDDYKHYDNPYGKPYDKYDEKYEDKYDEKYDDKCKCKDKHEDKYDDKCEDKCKCKNKDEDKYDDKYDDKCKCKDKDDDKYDDKCEDKCKCKDKDEDKHDDKHDEKYDDKCKCKDNDKEKYRPNYMKY